VKICKDCKEPLPLRDFRTDTRTRDGLSRFCDNCNLTRDPSKHLTSKKRDELYNQGVRFTDPNVFSEVLRVGHDEDYEAQAEGLPTDAPPGSKEKIEVLTERVVKGQPLWHELDRVDYSLLRGGWQMFDERKRGKEKSA